MERNRKSIMIWGRKLKTAPIPASNPSTRSPMAQSEAPCAARKSPAAAENQPVNSSIHVCNMTPGEAIPSSVKCSVNIIDSAKVRWKTMYMKRKKIGSPNNL